MTTQFTYLNKEYQVDIDPLNWYDNDKTTLVSLPDGTILKAEDWESFIGTPTTPILVAAITIQAKEVDAEELAFQSLLQEYDLTDNTKTRKLWYKCYERGHSHGLSEVCNAWHDLVDLIKD